ncbi:helix-turn-helix domain-containing protein [Nocardia sp. NPDC003726]
MDEVKLSDLEVEWAYYCLAEMMRHRRRIGAPIPDHIRRLFDRLGNARDAEEPDPRIESDEISAETAAAILGCSPQWVRKIAADLDGVHVGRIWVFNRATVEEYARARSAA